MARGPLDHPKLAAIARRLDEAQLEDAQHLLAQLGDDAIFRPATSYLTTRLLYLRGLLSEAQVSERLERLLLDVGDFPEALDMLEAARSGTLSREPRHSLNSRPPLAGRLQRDEAGLRDAELRAAFGKSEKARTSVPTNLRQPEIPHAGRVPTIEQPPGSSEPGGPPSIPDLDIPGGSVRAPGFDAVLRSESHSDSGSRAQSPEAPAVTERDPDLSAPTAGEEHSLRYSASQIPPDVVAVARREMPRAPAANLREAPDRERATRREVGHRPVPADPPAITSGAPPPMQSPVVTLFDVARLLDAGRIEDALSALGQRNSTEPDHVLMQARVLARAAREPEAKELVQKLSHAPLLEPEIRAGVARLALELNEPELALEQAERAHQDDPDQPMVTLSLAWAALRSVRRTASVEAYRVASRCLKVAARGGRPKEALLLALAACLEAHGGSAEEADRMARRALDIETTADGLAALAMASARLGRTDEVRRACAELSELEPNEARALELSLEQHGEQLFALGGAGPASGPVVLASEQLFGPLELALVSGSAADAWHRFAQLAEDTLTQVKPAARREAPALAAVAASFLTVAPISRDFAPYDETAASLCRVRALANLLALGARASDAESRASVVLLLGSYVGEVLRQAIGLRWNGTITDASAHLEAQGTRVEPFDLASAQLTGGGDLLLNDAVARAMTEGMGRQPSLPAVAPPCPWDPSDWPDVVDLPTYALAMRRSVIALHCEQHGTPLDGSLASLGALDDYLELLAPDTAPRPRDPAWARRTSVLVGSYLGQVLCDERGAKWTASDHLPGAERYGILLGAGRAARPIHHVLRRLTTRTTPLRAWAHALPDDTR